MHSHSFCAAASPAQSLLHSCFSCTTVSPAHYFFLYNCSSCKATSLTQPLHLHSHASAHPLLLHSHSSCTATPPAQPLLLHSCSASPPIFMDFWLGPKSPTGENYSYSKSPLKKEHFSKRVVLLTVYHTLFAQGPKRPFCFSRRMEHFKSRLIGWLFFFLFKTIQTQQNF